MKNRFFSAKAFLAFLFFAVIQSNTALHAQVDLDKGQIVYLPFDSSGQNKSSNRLPQTDLQMSQITYTKGVDGSAFGAPYFYGNGGGRMEHGVQSPNVTFSLWFNTDAGQKESMLMGWDKTGYGVTMKLGGKINVFLHITNNLTYSYDHDKNLADGQWHQVIGSYDGETFKVYIDGENVRQNNQYGTGKAVRFDAPGFNLGGLPKEGLQRYFTGLLDEVMIYNRALSDQEVQILAHKGKVVADDDLENPILYLPFEQHDQNLSSCLFQSTEVEVSGGSFATSCSPVGGESMKLLNGNGDYLAGSSILEVPQFTLSFWMSTYSAKESFIAGWDTTGYRIKLNPKGSVGKLQVQLWVSKKEILTLSSSSENLNDGQCRHIAVSYDGQMCRLFIDGSMQDEKKVEAGKPGTTMGVFHAASTFLIGSERENNPQVGFQGKIDEIRLYNRALDKNEIKKLTIPQKPAPLQHRFYDSAGIGAQSTFLAASNFSSKPAKIEVQDANRKVLFSQKIKPGEHILKVFPVKLDRRSVKVFWE